MRPVLRTTSESGKPAVAAAAFATDGTRACFVDGGADGLVDGEADGLVDGGSDSSAPHGWHGWHFPTFIGECSAPHGSESTVSRL
jgi:hypothetical protein